MAEHVHGWELAYSERDGFEAYCRDWRSAKCRKTGGGILGQSDIENRLDAIEMLSAETAHAIWRKLDALSQEHLGYEFALNAYASALEEG